MPEGIEPQPLSKDMIYNTFLRGIIVAFIVVLFVVGLGMVYAWWAGYPLNPVQTVSILQAQYQTNDIKRLREFVGEQEWDASVAVSGNVTSIDAENNRVSLFVSWPPSFWGYDTEMNLGVQCEPNETFVYEGELVSNGLQETLVQENVSFIDAVRLSDGVTTYCSDDSCSEIHQECVIRYMKQAT